MAENEPDDVERERLEHSEYSERLVAHIYGELADPDARALEREMALDPELRVEWDALGRTRAELDRWQAPVCDVDDEAAEVGELAAADCPPPAWPPPAWPRPARPRRARPLAAGLAAALVGFLSLAALGAEVRREGDRLSLSLRLPWADPAPVPTVDLAALAGRLADAEQVAGMALEISDAQARHFADWARRERGQLQGLALAVDRALTSERQRTASWIGALGRGAAHQDLITREALAGLASLVVQDSEH